MRLTTVTDTWCGNAQIWYGHTSFDIFDGRATSVLNYICLTKHMVQWLNGHLPCHKVVANLRGHLNRSKRKSAIVTSECFSQGVPWSSFLNCLLLQRNIPICNHTFI